MTRLGLTAHPAAAFESTAAEFGFANWVLFDTGRGRFSIASAVIWIMPAIRHRQIVFLFDNRGKPVAYATWAFVSDAVLEALRADRVAALEPTEWNEGLNLWIVDIVAMPGCIRPLMRRLRQAVGAAAPEAHGLRRGPDGNIVRQIRVRRPRSDLRQALQEESL